jgi:hypothetical protein
MVAVGKEMFEMWGGEDRKYLTWLLFEPKGTHIV